MLIRVLASPVPGHRRDRSRTGEPLTFGVPLPRGAVSEPVDWSITANGRSSAAQARVLDRWPDGTARWVLVDSQVNLGPAGRDVLELAAGGARPETDLRVTTGGPAGAIAVRTGAAEFTLKPGRSFPVASVQSGSGPLLDLSSCRLIAAGPDGVRHDAQIEKVQVEVTGAVRSDVRLEGTLAAGDQGSLALTARVHFFAGLSAIRLQITITNPNRAAHEGGFWDLGDAGSVLLKDVALVVPIQQRDAMEVLCSPEPGAPLAAVQTPFELYQDSSGGDRWQSSNHINRERRIPVTFRGYRLRSAGHEQLGHRASPWVVIRGGGSTIGMAVPHFWQNFPKAVEVTDRTLRHQLFPGQFADLHELQGGEQKTHECWLAFGDDPASLDVLDWSRSPTVACVDPAWTQASGAVPFLAPLPSAHAALVNTAIEGPDRFELKREVIDEYGWRHFGDIYGDHESVRQKDPPIVSHYNNQYDALAGFIQQFLRTADSRWWTMADELAAHVIDIDVYHTTRDKSAYNGGLFWHTYHYGDADTATHRTYPKSARGRIHGGGPSADHNYTTGLMLHYFLTGNAASRDTVIGLGDFVINMDDGNLTVFRWLDRGDTGRAIQSATGYFGPGRGPANSLNALIDARRLSGHARFEQKADQIVRRVLHPWQDLSALRLDITEQRWFYTMFLQSLGKYLHDRAERGLLDGAYHHARASLLHLARWMAENEHPYLDRPEKLEFPTETWPAQDIRKGDAFAFAAMHADAQDRSRFAERAGFFYRYSLEKLASMPTRALARPVVVLLGSGAVAAWLTMNPDAVEPAPRSTVQLDGPETFIPQRVRAERKARVFAAGGALLLLAAALFFFLR